MKIEMLYGNDAFVLPASVLQKLDRASKRDIKTLLCLASSPGLRGGSSAGELAAACGCSSAELETSLAFWRGAGVIDTGDQTETETVTDEPPVAVKKETGPAAKPAPADSLPSYTTAELSDILKKNKSASLLIDECQNMLGKMFNPHEVGIVLGMLDYLGLDGEYILVLFDHCVRMGKKSIHYIQKRAFSLYDEGITDASSLHGRLDKIEAAATLEGEIRSLFGMKARELTTKEKKFISAWVGDFGYGMDEIRKAYEMTVDAIHEPSPAYTNAIIERWHKEGLRTLEQIEASQTAELPSKGSFDTDDFFEAALKRSFSDGKKG